MYRLSADMKSSGHTQNFRKTILRRVVAKYLTSFSKYVAGDMHIYRFGPERASHKQENQPMNKNDSWFRKGGVTSTLCGPPTPGGILARMVERSLQL